MKSPRLYFADTGLLCHLLGIASRRGLERSPFFGPVFENFVVGEVVKHQVGGGRRREVYYFRDRQGLEVDLLVPLGARRMLLMEVKAGKTVFANDAAPLLRLRRAMKRYEATCLVIYQPTQDREALTALQPGVRAVSVRAMLEHLQ